ncbi:MAG TPA: DUF2804 family protein [Solirubrobacterales bacterium]|nr:DUF2804 family protein [Solirubrobacterales bacterium]
MRRSSFDAAEIDRLPWRGPGDGRPALPLPPGKLPMFGPGRRLRKRWRYVGVFCDEFMLCAARAQVGPFGQTFWAVVDRSSGEIWERTRKLPPFVRGEVWSERAEGGHWPIGSDEPGVVTLLDANEVGAGLRIGEGRWAESICPAEGPGESGYVWTRKRIAPVECDLRLPGGRRIERTAYGIEDESAGYHPRHTVWSWSAGVGVATDGRAVGWNLVSGVNDPPERSERAIWLDGEPREPGPVRFDDDLSGIDFESGSRLDFDAEATRRASENLGLLRFTYRQPFGSFSGSLDGTELAEAYGVMEHHDAVW